MLCNMRKVSYNRIGTYGFEVKSEKKTLVCPRCRQNLKNGHYTLNVPRETVSFVFSRVLMFQDSRENKTN